MFPSLTSCCGRDGALHSGHSGFCAHQLATHSQQNTCPQGVAVAASCGDRHNAHFFPSAPSSPSAFELTRGGSSPVRISSPSGPRITNLPGASSAVDTPFRPPNVESSLRAIADPAAFAANRAARNTPNSPYLGLPSGPSCPANTYRTPATRFVAC